MAKDFFGNEYPTYAERLALARAAKMCLEAGRMTPEALSLLDGAADDRLYTFLLNHAFIVYRGPALETKLRIMGAVVRAVFQDAQDIEEAIQRVDETAYDCILSYLECLDTLLGGKHLPEAFFALCEGKDVDGESVVVHRKTGEIVRRKEIRLSGHDALRRAALAAQIKMCEDYPSFLDDTIEFLSGMTMEVAPCSCFM